MIGRLTGIVAEKTPPQVLLDVQGVGYEVDVPMSSFYNLPALGERTTLLTHFVVREDAQLLYGFLSSEERAAQVGETLVVVRGKSVADDHGKAGLKNGNADCAPERARTPDPIIRA